MSVMNSADTIDVTVLAFAQWLSEMRSRSNSSLQQMLAEMGIIRNGITSNNTDLTEFKRNTATVQQQMQSQISDLRDKLTDAYTEIANMKKTKSQFEQEVQSEYQSLAEALQFKTLEMETLKKAYAQTHQQLQQQIISLQSDIQETRMKQDDASRAASQANEQTQNTMAEIDMAAQYANNELKKLRSDHDHAIANVAENMNRWNETLRDLSKEFHGFQKVMNVNQQKMQSNFWDLQNGKQGPSQPGQSQQAPSQGQSQIQTQVVSQPQSHSTPVQGQATTDGRLESASDVSRNSYPMLPQQMPQQLSKGNPQATNAPQMRGLAANPRPQLRTTGLMYDQSAYQTQLPQQMLQK